jgi:kynurenine formamidase
MPRFIDISITIDNDTAADPPPMRPLIVYRTHDASAADLAGLFPGMTVNDLPEKKGWAVETITLSTHNGTHVDAPWHYHPTMDGGVRAWSIEEVPLEWFMQPGVKLDFRHLPDGHVVSASDIETELARIGHDLRPLEIVVVNTCAGMRYGTPEYLNSGCGMGRETTLFLASKGVRVVGTDGWSWDAPFSHTARRYSQTHDASIVWEGHKAGRDVGYCQIEKLHNLEVLPPFGFTVVCFPTKIKSASAGWTRAVAILPGYSSGKDTL